MRAIWKGAVSFGLVSIGVKLYSATEEKDIRFHQVHREDGGRIKYKRTCSICGEEVSYDDIAKGYDLGGGEMVILTEDQLRNLPRLLAGRQIYALAITAVYTGEARRTAGAAVEQCRSRRQDHPHLRSR